jgi:hypothetical protein
LSRFLEKVFDQYANLRTFSTEDRAGHLFIDPVLSEAVRLL